MPAASRKAHHLLSVPLVADGPEVGPRRRAAEIYRSFVLNTARAHDNRAPRQEGHTLKGRSGGLGAEPEGSSASAPYQTVSRAGLPVKPVAVPRCAKVSCRRSRLLRRPPAAAPACVHRRRPPRPPLRGALPVHMEDPIMELGLGPGPGTRVSCPRDGHERARVSGIT